ncbi:MAG: 3-oxoacyl-ACP reductase FabG [Gammaproteobacteria bacterium]|nr:3-oxoacyl-ACP reductase FabG [Gammaproteobacteria bacterium]
MKQALVTGGSGDIGAAICYKLAQQGLHVIVHAMNRPEHAGDVTASIIASGGSAEAICFDVSDAEASRKILESKLANRPIQIIVSNAGIHDDVPLAGMSYEQWHRVIDVSLHGFYNVTQPLLLPMMRTHWGRVIAISSIAAQLGNRGQANYAAAKAGLHGAVKSLSQELASRGITANVVAPGIIQGEMTDNLFDKETIKKMVPAQRAGLPDEVADLVAFLASDNAAYISGQVIGINGGIV